MKNISAPNLPSSLLILLFPVGILLSGGDGIALAPPAPQNVEDVAAAVCQLGGKEMTLAEERELEVVKGGLTYVGADDHSDSPHWHARYPWLIDPSTLPNNIKAVEATFLRTERQLAKELQWKKAYGAQVHEMVDRRAARKLTKENLTNWNGPVWYISHLIAPNPHSVTTPVRLVWNSSQKYKGQSLNDLLMKGPDVLNSIRAVLLKFRQGSYAALGDVRKNVQFCMARGEGSPFTPVLVAGFRGR